MQRIMQHSTATWQRTSVTLGLLHTWMMMMMMVVMMMIIIIINHIVQEIFIRQNVS